MCFACPILNHNDAFMQMRLSLFTLEGRILDTWDRNFTYTINTYYIEIWIYREWSIESTSCWSSAAFHNNWVGGIFLFVFFCIFNHRSFPQTVQTHRHDFLSSVWQLLILPEGMLAFIYLEVFLHQHKDKYKLCLSSEELYFWDILSQSWYRYEKLNEY